MFYSLFFSTLPLFGLVLIGFISGKFDLLNKSDSKVFLKARWSSNCASVRY